MKYKCTTGMAFYIGKKSLNPKATLIDRAICFIDGSNYSHCEVVLSYSKNGLSKCIGSSNREDGVREKEIDLTSGRWVFVPFYFNTEAAYRIFESVQHYKYDYIGLGKTVFSWFPHQKNKMICSAFAMRLFSVENYKLYGIKDAYKWAVSQCKN